jgi:hypothetical protein
MMSSTPSPPFSSVDDTPDSSPLCQNPPSPMMASGRRALKFFTAALDAMLMP